MLEYVDDVLVYRAEWQSVGGAASGDPRAFRQLVLDLVDGRFDAADQS